MSSQNQRPAPGAAGERAAEAFFVYVEGARDRDILQSWARSLSRNLSRLLVRQSVILGGRQPARARDHLRSWVDERGPARGLCVLDRDHDAHPEPGAPADADLAFFTWKRRHIESYLLVPDAIRRGLRMRDHDGHFDRLLREHLPPLEDEAALRTLDAKRLLGRKGPVSKAVGRPVEPGRIAKVMRPEEFHPEIHDLLAWIGRELGVGPTRTEVSFRVAGSPSR